VQRKKTLCKARNLCARQRKFCVRQENFPHSNLTGKF
jgi:hypothetical protein